MAIKITGGEFTIEYGTNGYTGLNVQAPETNIPDTASPSFNNFMLRNAELRSRATLVSAYPSPGLLVAGISSFLDINGAYHTVLWEGENMYQYGGGTFNLVGQAAPGNMDVPVAYRAFAETIYYTSIGSISGFQHRPPQIYPFMGYWNGLTAAPVYQQTYSDASTSNSVAGISLSDSPTVGGSLPGGPTIVGPISIGGQFLNELNDQLLLANVSILDQGTNVTYNYPNLIWWSANGLPLQWDPTQNTSAGFNPFLDVGDAITGLAMIGVAGYIFRTNGITEMTPTGSAITPFEFDHLWASDHGIGNVYPYSIAQYGGQCIFISTDNVYIITLSGIQPIGGGARDAIFADLANATGTPFANIVPYFQNGYVYLTYELYIPFQNFVRLYAYSIEDQNWAPWDLALASDGTIPALTCTPNVV